MDLFNELFGSKIADNIIFSPQKIALEMIEALPSEIWNRHTKFLDPCCKSGIFLKEIRRKLMASEDLIQAFSDEDDREEHIDTTQLYGLSVSERCLLTSTRNAYGRLRTDSNIRYINNYIQQVKDKDTDYKKLIKEEFGEVKFDVVIGNPPYQETNRSIYHYFIHKGIELNPQHIMMIVKNNWLCRDEFQDIRNTMINYGLKTIVNYSKSGDIFPEVSVAVTIIDIQRNFKGNTQYREIVRNQIVEEFDFKALENTVIHRGKEESTIVTKTFSKNNMSKRAMHEKVFGIATDGKIGFSGKGQYVNASINKKMSNDIKLMYMDGRKHIVKYISRSDVPKGTEYIDKYKIVCGRILALGQNVITSISVVEPSIITSQSWGILSVCDNINEAKHIEKYVKTRFFRYLARVKLGDGTNTIGSGYFEYVPLQDFTLKSDINWSQSVAEIDKQLYQKYNITQDEIDYIEKIIKPMV